MNEKKSEKQDNVSNDSNVSGQEVVNNTCSSNSANNTNNSDCYELLLKLFGLENQSILHAFTQTSSKEEQPLLVQHKEEEWKVSNTSSTITTNNVVDKNVLSTSHVTNHNNNYNNYTAVQEMNQTTNELNAFTKSPMNNSFERDNNNACAMFLPTEEDYKLQRHVEQQKHQDNGNYSLPLDNYYMPNVNPTSSLILSSTITDNSIDNNVIGSGNSCMPSSLGNQEDFTSVFPLKLDIKELEQFLMTAIIPPSGSCSEHVGQHAVIVGQKETKQPHHVVHNNLNNNLIGNNNLIIYEKERHAFNVNNNNTGVVGNSDNNNALHFFVNHNNNGNYTNNHYTINSGGKLPQINNNNNTQLVSASESIANGRNNACTNARYQQSCIINDNSNHNQGYRQFISNNSHPINDNTSLVNSHNSLNLNKNINDFSTTGPYLSTLFTNNNNIVTNASYMATASQNNNFISHNNNACNNNNFIVSGNVSSSSSPTTSSSLNAVSSSIPAKNKQCKIKEQKKRKKPETILKVTDNDKDEEEKLVEEEDDNNNLKEELQEEEEEGIVNKNKTKKKKSDSEKVLVRKPYDKRNKYIKPNEFVFVLKKK
ncbi:hypothetical protein ABK040_012792 [Willaertia magna]